MSRVLIATASDATRSWVAAFPPGSRHIAIVGVVPLDGGLAARAQELDADVVVVDAADADADAIASALENVGDPAVGIVLLTSGEGWHPGAADLVRGGIRAVLSPHPTAEELEAAVRSVAAGLVVLEPRILEMLSQADNPLEPGVPTGGSAAQETSPSRAAEPSLTPREIDVLNALASGLGNKQIAARLAISEHTVKTHVAAIFEKLGVSNRTEAVMTGARHGLILL